MDAQTPQTDYPAPRGRDGHAELQSFLRLPAATRARLWERLRQEIDQREVDARAEVVA